MSPFAGYDDFDACTRDNQDKDDPEAYCGAIKQQVEGAELTEREQAALERSNCPEGHVEVNGQCVPVEETENVPPSALSMPAVHLERFDPDTIERIEASDDTVRYTNIKLIGPGEWTDSNSRRTVEYTPELMQNATVDPDNSVHINHDSGNDVSEVGHIDPESVENADNGVFADIVIDTSTPAGAFADENMQATLESGGAKGFGGPSVEIPPEGQEIEFDRSQGMETITDGKIDGMGLVSNPASRDVHFARQSANTAVALSDGSNAQSLLVPATEDRRMSDVTVDTNALLDTFDLEADDLDLAEDKELADVPAEDLLGMIAATYDDQDEFMQVVEATSDEMYGGDDEDDEEPEDRENEDDDPEDDEEEDEGMDMNEMVEALDERVSAIEDQMDSLAAQDDLEELEGTDEELEAAQEELEALREDKRELESRVATLEDEPKDPKTLSDGDTVADDPDTVFSHINQPR